MSRREGNTTTTAPRGSASIRETGGKVSPLQKGQMSPPAMSSNPSAANSAALPYNYHTDLATVPEDIVVRSLRRRLWKALRDENAALALQLWNASRASWESLVRAELHAAQVEWEAKIRAEQEAAAAAAAAAAAKQPRPGLLKTFLHRSKRHISKTDAAMLAEESAVSNERVIKSESKKGGITPTSTTASSVASSPINYDVSTVSSGNLAGVSTNITPLYSTLETITTQDDASHPQFSILQLYMNPSDPFNRDDYKHPITDSYESDDEQNNRNYTSNSSDDEAGGGLKQRLRRRRIVKKGSNQTNNRHNGHRQARQAIGGFWSSVVTRRTSASSAVVSDTHNNNHQHRRRHDNTDGAPNSNQLINTHCDLNPGSRRGNRRVQQQMMREKNSIQALSPRHDTTALQTNTSSLHSNRSSQSVSDDSSTSTDGFNCGDEIVQDKRMTTPLHEAARLGHGQLVRAMLLLQPASSLAHPNTRNGMGRTVLHMIAGGVTMVESEYMESQKLSRQQEEALALKIQSAGVESSTATGNSDKAHEATTPSDSKGKSSTKPQDASQSVGKKSNGDTKTQSSAIVEVPVGIRIPEAILPEAFEPEHEKTGRDSKAKKAVRAVGRFFRSKKESEVSPVEPANSQDTTQEKDGHQLSTADLDSELWNQLVRDRVDAALAVLSWSHPQDGEGPSVNAVDSLGRTALHYAAELGRSDICFAVLGSFGAMLTIVDDRARTPCELAAEGKHDELAAQLEARALLYLDPYGMDDELLASILADGSGYPRNVLAPPFSWFETWTIEKVNEERDTRVKHALERMKKIIQMRLEGKNARNLMFSQVIGESPLDSQLSDSKPPPKDHVKTAHAVNGKSASDSNSPQDRGTVSIGHAKSPPEGKTTLEDAMPVDAAKSNIDSKASSSSSLEATEDDGKATNDEKKPMATDKISIAGNAAASTPPVASVQKIAAHDLVTFASLNESYVELFLQYHNWNVKNALEAFFEGPFEAFEAAHIPISRMAVVETQTGKDRVCQICYDTFDAFSEKWCNLEGCQHSFCTECLGDYLAECAKSKTSGLAVLCPNQCDKPLFPFEVEELSSPEVYKSLVAISNENFVVSSRDFRFCPHPGCGGIVKYNVPAYVKRSNLDEDILDTVGAVCTAVRPKVEGCPITYDGVCDPNYFDSRGGVQPAKAHRFCFACGEPGVHWPVTCSKLERWNNKVQEEIKDVLDEDGDADYNDVAMKLWIKANTRPCPKCKCPIEKNEGCNHMTCSNPHCKYEFCWICRNDWKLHNTETGGFFRCNRWQEEKEHNFYDTPPPTQPEGAPPPPPLDVTDPRQMEATYGTAMHETKVSKKRSREMARFLHHYQRWNAHLESAALERHMAETACKRLEPVVAAAIEFSCDPDFNFGGKGLSFVYAAFTELLECRSMLQHSYAFSYFRYKNTQFKKSREMKRKAAEKMTFEQLQLELEMMTEQMSDIVARSHLRATQSQIIFLTATTADKRKEFSNLMINILVQERKDKKEKERQNAESEAAAAEQKPAPNGSDPNQRKSQKEVSSRLPESAVAWSNITGMASSANAASAALPRVVLAPSIELTRTDMLKTTEASEDEHNEVNEALRRSLEDFLTNTGARAVLDVDEQGAATIRDWPCLACTYVNTGGRRCAMCGTAKSN